MILRPFEYKDVFDDLIPEDLKIASESSAENLLAGRGEGDVKFGEEKDKNKIKDIFTTAGAGVKDAAKNIAQVMRSGDNDSSRLRAAELALKVQGIFNDIDEKQIPEIKINIIGSDNKTLINLLLPK